MGADRTQSNESPAPGEDDGEEGQEATDGILDADPREFYESWRPGVVHERLDDGETAKVSFADIDIHDSGALAWRTWDGEVGLLPEWRWTEVSFIDTERVYDEHGYASGKQSVTEDDWGRLPDTVREEIADDE